MLDGDTPSYPKSSVEGFSADGLSEGESNEESMVGSVDADADPVRREPDSDPGASSHD